MGKSFMPVIGLLVALAGCSNTPPADSSAQQGGKGSVAVETAQPKVAAVVPQAVAETDAQRLARLTKPVAGKSVFFAYDTFTVAQDQMAAVQAHAEVLRQSPTAVISLEGNADERGSREYNLALGQKRADAVANVMRLKGIDASRIETVSFGEEKPREACHEERCWTLNRRVDFQYRLRR